MKPPNAVFRTFGFLYDLVELLLFPLIVGHAGQRVADGVQQLENVFAFAVQDAGQGPFRDVALDDVFGGGRLDLVPPLNRLRRVSVELRSQQPRHDLADATSEKVPITGHEIRAPLAHGCETKKERTDRWRLG